MHKDFKFDSRADRYDTGFEGKLSEKFYNLVTENIELSDGSHILDAGCGTGTILQRLSERYHISGAGIDVEEKMLEHAKKKCPDMDIRCCPCDHTPFPDASFDAVIACMAYHHFPNKAGFAKEAARLTKPGGKLYISEPKFPLPVRKCINAILKRHGIAGEFFTADEIIADFADFGFEKANVKLDAYAQIVILVRKAENGTS